MQPVPLSHGSGCNFFATQMRVRMNKPRQNSTDVRHVSTSGRQMMSHTMMKSRGARMRLLLWMFVVCTLALPAFAAAPPVVVTAPVTIASGLPSSQQAVAVDACGDIYDIAAYNGQVYRTPAAGGTPTAVLSSAQLGPNYLIESLWIDAAKAYLYVTEGSGNILRIPITSCVPQASSAASISLSNLGAISWYFNANAIASDSSNNVFIATNTACCAAAYELLEEDSTSTTGTVLIASLTQQIDSLTVDSAGDIFYATGGSVYELPYSGSAYASTPVSFGGSFSNATGVSVDASGNLFVTDQSAGLVYEIPMESGTLNAADRFVVAAGLTISGAIAPAVNGNYYFVAGDTSVYAFNPAAANVGSLGAGSSSSLTSTVYLNNATSAANFAVASGGTASITGGSCASGSSYAAGSSCTVQVQVTASAPGMNRSALTVTDGSSSALATLNLALTSTGAGITSDPGSLTALYSGASGAAGVAIDATGDIFAAVPGSNEVIEIAAGSSSAVNVGSGLSAPESVAVDGAGNLFIADTGNNRIVEVPKIGGTLASASQQVVLASTDTPASEALNGPSGIALDGVGNLYVADSGNGRVLFLSSATQWQSSTAVALTTGLDSPSSVAVDATGDVFLTDAGSGAVYEISGGPASPSRVRVLSGYSEPSGIAIDASGALLIVDRGNADVWRIPNLSGTLTASSAVNITGQLNSQGAVIVSAPQGVALDASGNAYVGDGGGSVYQVNRTAASQSVGIVAPGSTGDAVTFSVENSGNASLTFASPYASLSGDTAAFSVSAGESSACADGLSVSSGSSCVVEAVFAPGATGSYSLAVALQSNAVNAGTLSLTYTGSGLVTTSTSTAVAKISPTGTPSYDDTVAFQAAVTSSDGIPTGTVTLSVDGISKQTSTLTNGIASFSIAGGVLSGGTHSIVARYNGNQTDTTAYAASTSSTLSVTVAAVATTTTLNYATAYTSPNSQPAGTSLTLTATINTAYAGTPTGSVLFTISDPNGTITTATVALSVAGSAYQASYTYTPSAPATSSGYDTDTVVAQYLGDANFASSSSEASSFVVTDSAGMAIVTASGLSLTSTASTPGSITFVNTSYGGFSGIVGYSCDASTLPAHTRCVFSPGQATVIAGATAPTVTLYLYTNQSTATTQTGGFTGWGTVLGGVMMLFLRRRVKALSTVFSCMAVALLALGLSGALTGCGGSVSTNTAPTTQTITVYASADPYSSLTSQSTVTCSTASTYPCSQQAFQVSVTVK